MTAAADRPATAELRGYKPPPDGWRDFGFHAAVEPPLPALTFSEDGPDGLPRWEKHANGSPCTCEPQEGEARFDAWEVNPRDRRPARYRRIRTTRGTTDRKAGCGRPTY